MSTRAKAWALAGLVMTASGLPALAQGQDAAVLKDLTAVIALNGQPCGQVISAVRQGDNNYVATCKDGNRYRVTTSAQGRVLVQKQ